MRDPARIDRLIGLLRAYWHAHPDLRLGQIVGNLTPRTPVSISMGRAHTECDMPGDSYYVEDDVIETALKVPQ